MPAYANYGGASSVTSYDFGDSWVEVTFNDGRTYRWDGARVGSANIVAMQKLAVAGRGLCSYIHRCVKFTYTWKRLRA